MDRAVVGAESSASPQSPAVTYLLQQGFWGCAQPGKKEVGGLKRPALAAGG